MNQETTEEIREEQGPEDFDAGFDFETEEKKEPEEAANPATPEPEQPTAENAASEQLPTPPQLERQSEPQQIQDKQQEPAMLEKAPEGIAEELENLRKLNPKAAELAMEDSPEGEAIRRRLENYGAEQAQDRAEMTLFRRQQDYQREKEMQARMDAYNRNFQETIRKGAPEFFAMTSDPGRKAEAAQYIKNLDSWIESKPFREGMKLMQIRQKGNAEQVCALISQFEKEKGINGKKQDATALLAVPSRGTFSAPASIGDKDDFDAGWELNK